MVGNDKQPNFITCGMNIMWSQATRYLRLYNQHHNNDTAKIPTQHHSTQNLTFLYADRYLKIYILAKQKRSCTDFVFYEYWGTTSQAQEIWLYNILYVYLQITWCKIAGICQILHVLGVWHTFYLKNSAQTKILYIMTAKVSQYDV
jgi:hypothetical protein